MTQAAGMAGLSLPAGLWRGLRLSIQRAHGSALPATRLWSCQQGGQAHLCRQLASASAAGGRRAAAAAAAAAAADHSGAAPTGEGGARLHLFNTLTRQKEAFRPRPDQGNRVSMYVCGVTVYDYSHIGEFHGVGGHARVYVAFDALFRFLRHLGYDVTYVRNFTDVDDKIIARAGAGGEDPLALARRFIAEFHADMASRLCCVASFALLVLVLGAAALPGLFARSHGSELLGCLPPTLEPKATEYIPQMIDMIQRIIGHGHAYAVGGDVFFDVASLPGYGRLSGRAQEDNRAGERVAVDARKRGAADFALWKAAKPGEPTWDSPWGPGRPGWHIDAMIRALLGPEIDIHGGGRDLVFPHHENELAQSRAAEARCACGHDHARAEASSSRGGGEEPPSGFVRYWVHNGESSPSQGSNGHAPSCRVRSLHSSCAPLGVVARYHPRALRWFLLGTQYRQPINYTQARPRSGFGREEGRRRVQGGNQGGEQTLGARALEEASDRLYYLYQTLADTAAALADVASANGSSSSSSTATSSSSSSSSSSSAAAASSSVGGGVGVGGGPGEELLAEVLAALADDLNTPLAVAAMSTPLKAMNDLLHTKQARCFWFGGAAGHKAAGRLEALASCRDALRQALRLLGLWAEEPEAVLAELRVLALVRAGLTEAAVAAAIQERAAARSAKDYAAADAVRLRMEALGVLLMDTPGGTAWKPGPRLHIAEEERAAEAAGAAIELGPPSVGASPIASASAPPFLAPEGGAGFGKLPPLAENGSLHGGSGYSPRAQEGPRVKPLSLLPLIALIFYDVSGGPFGVEIAVSKGAPLLALLGFIILPIVCRTFPRALGGALVLVVFSYLIPLLVGLGVTTDPNDWKLGGFTLVGEIVGGKWLGCKYGTPTLGILCSSLGVMTMASFNFMQIVQLLNCVYCLGELLEFAAFIWLRIKYPQLHRPYRIPLPTWACGALLLPAGGLLTLLLLAPVVERDWGVVLFTAVCGLTGFAVHPLLQLARRREWCAFDGGTVHEFKERLYTMFAPRPAGDTRDSEACSEAQPMLPGAR
eukprot:scaffold3.g6630.t1